MVRASDVGSETAEELRSFICINVISSLNQIGTSVVQRNKIEVYKRVKYLLTYNFIFIRPVCVLSDDCSYLPIRSSFQLKQIKPDHNHADRWLAAVSPSNAKLGVILMIYTLQLKKKLFWIIGKLHSSCSLFLLRRFLLFTIQNLPQNLNSESAYSSHSFACLDRFLFFGISAFLCREA